MAKSSLFEFTVRTSSHTQMIDITRQVQDIVEQSGVNEGMNAVKDLELTVGKTAYAVIKATSVMVGVDD